VKLEAGLAHLLSSLGLVPRAVEGITALPYRDGGRATWRVHLDGGGSVKARRLLGAAKGRRIERLVGRLGDPRLARVLGRDGRYLVEEWVEGRTLGELPLDPGRLERAAELLGSLHARAPRPAPARRAERQARKALGRLAGAGAIARAEAEELLARLEPPALATVGFVHGDLCGENLVEDAAGRVHAIDNELLRIDFVDLDLARTWYRWPMPPASWATFVAAYRRWRDPLPASGEERFWRIAATARAAALRLARRGDLAGPPIDRLRSLLSG
jgi:hypothetical protein